jgi:orotate phosphoribosyltransferase
MIRLAQSGGGRVVGVAVLIDRSGARLDVGAPIEALAVVDLETYFTPVCPLCAAGRPLERRLE